MKLSDAKFGDHWRHVFAKPYPTRVTEASFTGLRGMEDIELTFSGGMNAIVGGNGVGKSTLVAAISELLGKHAADEAYMPRLHGSSAKGVAYLDNTRMELAIQHSDDAVGKNVSANLQSKVDFIEPATLAGLTFHQIHGDKAFNELLQSVTPIRLSSDDLQIVSYVVGKKYESVEIYEIQDYANLERFPYVRVTSDGVTYGSEGMGRGELCLLLTYWVLRSAGKNGILILEEPETHVSPRSQAALMNIVAKYSDEKSLWILITTHSPTIVRNIPKDNVKLLVRHNGPVKQVVATASDIAVLLGGGVAYRGLLLVEDVAAKRFVIDLLEQLDPEFLRQYEVVEAGSADNISGVLKVMPAKLTALSMAGIFDGDYRDRLQEGQFAWPHFFAPGTVAPDQLLVTYVLSLTNLPKVLSGELGKTDDAILIALNTVTGVDSHDFVRVFAGAMRLDVLVVRRALARIWLAHPPNREVAELFLAELRKLPTSWS